MTTNQIEELGGLTSNEIWALNDLSKGKITNAIKEMNQPQKVAVKTLLILNLVQSEGEGENRKVVLTNLGEKFLETANKILD